MGSEGTASDLMETSSSSTDDVVNVAKNFANVEINVPDTNASTLVKTTASCDDPEISIASPENAYPSSDSKLEDVKKPSAESEVMMSSKPLTKAALKDKQAALEKSNKEKKPVIELHVSFYTLREDIEIGQQVVLQVLTAIAEVSGYNQVSHKFNPQTHAQHGYGFAAYAHLSCALKTFSRLKGACLDGVFYDVDFSFSTLRRVNLSKE
eukprot:gene40742-49688_t